MRIFISTILLVSATSAIFGQNRPLNKTLMHDGLQRRYTLYVPSGYTPENSVPLVVNMHGLRTSRSQQMTWSGMNEIAEGEGFLVVYPDAVSADWFGPQDNVGFIDALLDQVSSEYSVDASRVYATGLSQGGMMSYILSVQRPETFAAIASVAGPRPFDFGRDTDILHPPDVAATPNRPFPLLHIHGTSDSFIPYNGGRSLPEPSQYVFPPVEQFVGNYAVNNGCDTTPSITDLPNVDQTDRSTVTLVSYDNCDTYTASSGDSIAAEVLLYRIEGGGHTWPGGSTPSGLGVINQDINASQEIWNFFSRHSLPAIVELPGDFNADGVLDATDIDALSMAVRAENNPAEFDLSNDNRVNQSDRDIWIIELKRTYFGDANLDGEFNSGDFIVVFQAGQYEDAIAGNSTWSTGDWNGDADFDSGDFILAFQSAGYEVGPRVAAMVPEPSGGCLTSVAVLFLVLASRRGPRRGIAPDCNCFWSSVK